MTRSAVNLGRALLLALWLGIGAIAASGARANEAAPLAEDPVAEQRLIAISAELRCLVCQNESLAGSRADLANDLRREIREMIHAGKSDAEIMDFLVARYGDFVRYRPPLKPSTWLLWGGPFVLLLLAIVLLLRFLRQRGSAPAAPPLSAADEERARALLTTVPPNDKTTP